jgi:outer membrane protein assembly factor BamB
MNHGQKLATFATALALLTYPALSEEPNEERTQPTIPFAKDPSGKGQDNWTRFRGPNADGVAQDDPRLPDIWSKTENMKWVADVPGRGWSSPVVWGDKVFLTSVVSDGEDVAPKKGLYLGEGVKTPPKGVHHWLVYGFDLITGKLLWKHEAHKGEPTVPRHPKSNYAAETPTTDGERLYVLFGDVGLYCLDLDGKPLWSHTIEPKKTLSNYGAAASPIVHDGQVLLLYDNLENSYLASFNAKTGKQLWLTERDEPSTWASPFIWQSSLRTEIITCGKKKNRAYDLNGKLLWEFDGRMSRLVIPSPFAADGLLYITSGYVADQHRPVYAIKPGATGDITLKDGEVSNDYIAWYQPKSGPYNPSPLVYGGRYYTLLDQGFLTCHDAKSGKEIYGRERLGGSYTASPWAYNGKVFCLGEDGKTVVMKAGSEFELLRTNDLDELCVSTPAVSQGHLVIRTSSKLYCFTNATGK